MPQKAYQRIFSDVNHVCYFFEHALGIERDGNLETFPARFVYNRIVEAEKQLVTTAHTNTLEADNNRDPDYKEERMRKKLRQTIYSELISLPRPDEDEKIRLGNGGMLPRTSLKNNRQAYILIGLPASGKSGIANDLSDNAGAMIIDSDYAKRKFPEFATTFGADVVHEESSLIVFGGDAKYSDEPCVLEYAVQKDINIIIPKIGDDSNKIKQLASMLKQSGYTVHLVLTRLDRKWATIRACTRFLETGRYVPLSLIFDVYSNDPTITFYDLLLRNEVFDSYTMYSTDVPKGASPRLVYSSNKVLGTKGGKIDET